ncbi:MAG: glycosyltransferase family 2 protein [Acidobacteria bacterium]|nr:glycosyltransferase family 2 protein [Acidobacteriota bacterium]
MPSLLPLTAIVPTRNRSEVFRRMLYSLAEQSVQPAQLVVVDASTDTDTESICKNHIEGLRTTIIYQRAISVGAAVQRNQAFKSVAQPMILFLDDDIIFEPDCLSKMWFAANSGEDIGGVSAMITNQQYGKPGKISRMVYCLLHGRSEGSYAGMCIGPALNLLPADSPDLPEVVPVEWLNTTCTMYKLDALPDPPFPMHFTGYSLMEDVTLSLTVGRTWKLVNARTARIYHDTQPGEHKSNLKTIAKMDLINRYYVMTRVLRRKGTVNYSKLIFLQLFGLLSHLGNKAGWHSFPSLLIGKLAAVKSIVFMRMES